MEIGNSNFTTVHIKFYLFMSYEKCETCKHVFNHKCIFVNDNQIEKTMLKFSLTRSHGATSLTCATMGVQKILCHMALCRITKK